MSNECLECGSENIEKQQMNIDSYHYTCEDCGFEWEQRGQNIKKDV